MDDPLPAQLDYAGSLEYTSGAQDPDTCVFNPPSPPEAPSGTIHCTWAVFTKAGGSSMISFTVRGNENLTPGAEIHNIGYLQWTSLPSFGSPTRHNNNPFSTERYFDPTDPTINNYGTNAEVILNQLGGGEGGCKGVRCFRIPVAGFEPGVYTALGGGPAVVYDDNMSVLLQIPRLKLNSAIVGVPLVNGEWQVDWLSGVGGWLQGTAFPGLSGNSVIMSHITTHYGAEGPFAHLDTLMPGDNLFVTAFGRSYIYRVESVRNVGPDDISVFKHETKPVLTLITCSKYNTLTRMYDGRLVVRAALIQVTPLGH
jgi:LPXTG-site transpeptidase (sortase) family protein